MVHFLLMHSKFWKWKKNDYDEVFVAKGLKAITTIDKKSVIFLRRIYLEKYNIKLKYTTDLRLEIRYAIT